MERKKFSRRDFLRGAAMTAAGAALAACARPTPEVIVKEVPIEKVVKETVVVEKQVPVEKVVKETVVVQKEVPVEKVVEKTVVVKETVEVQKYHTGLPGKREECLIYGRGGRIEKFDSFNPYVPRASAWGEGMWAAQIEHGWYVNLATGEITPWLFTGYEYDKDYTQLTIKIRKGVEWNDGEPFLADDVIFTHEMIMAHDEMNPEVLRKQIGEMQALDDYTVRFKFKEPAPRFHVGFMAFVGARAIAPKHIWEKQKPVIFQNSPPVWTGPYKMIPTTREDGQLVWELNEKWWGVKTGFAKLPAPRYFIARQEPPADAEYEVALRNEIDIPSGLNYTLMQKLVTANPKFELATYLDPCPRGIYFNCDRITDVNVRRAIQYCCDSATIGKLVWQPPSRGTPFPWAGYGFLERYKSEEALKKYPREYNPEKAKELLDKAGYTVGADGIRVGKDGKKLSFACHTPAQKGDPQYEIGAAIAEEAKKVGIEITMKGYSNFWTLYDLWVLGEGDMASIWMCGGTPDPVNYFNQFHSRLYKPIGEKVGGSWECTPCRVRDPRLDEVVDKLYTLDPLSEEAKPYYAKALEIWSEICPGFPVIETLYTMAFNNTYWTNWPNEGNWYMVPFTWWDTFKMVLHGLKKA